MMVVKATFRRIPLIGISDFSGLLTQFQELNIMYTMHKNVCVYIFDIYDDTSSVKDGERLRRTSVLPVELSSIELTTPLHKDMTTFWPLKKNKFHLETLIYRQVCYQALEGESHLKVLSQLSTDINEWQCTKIYRITFRQHL